MYIPVKFNDGIEINPEITIHQATFQEIGLKETHLEEFLRRNINLILEEDETMLVVGQQVRNARNGISDLTALDAEGNIVLIEIKRDAQDIVKRREPFEFQAIRYAANYAKIKSPDELVDLVYATYIEQHRLEYDLGSLTPAEKARRELYRFLEGNEALKIFNDKQRIILIASAFDDQTLSAVAWMIENGVDISCFTVTPMFIGEQSFVNIDKILPPVPIDDFYVGLGKVADIVTPTTAGVSSREKRRFLPRMNQLFDWKLIKRGDKLKIRNVEDACAIAINDTHVQVDGKQLTYNQWGQEATGWSTINVYEWIIHDGEGKTLDELRRQKMAELEAQNEDETEL
ncbi:MAG TPA: hypothetical protein VLL52_04405 [Anaerolineae bacterium]|nr:hypothetical protein [Anaerolineae bacterium]